MRTYKIGQQARLTGSFAITAAADPTTVTFRYRPPSGTVVAKVYGTDIEVIRDSAGEYHIDLAPTEPGIYWYSWQGTGAVIAYDEYEFEVAVRNVQ